ncbi:amino acid adenylation domain-containing protein [Actinoplanes sp. NPDC051346]|uniref:amino acid adenylation domain-containing protein n=1 Tax=Actinoplanes sp. NPDC051346 TaxID=3155048 RepID=UPI003420A47D
MSTDIVTAFRARLAEAPNAVALEFADATLTYAELWERARRVAAGLAARGAGPETVVALAMDRSARLVTAMLGVLATGAAYLPLDPDHPAERRGFMVADSGAALILADRDTGFAADVPVVDWAEVDAEPLAALAPISADQRACVLYTSGSTGRPKGAEIVHRGVIGLTAPAEWTGFHAGDTIAQVANVSFDAATFEIWGALLNGARLVGVAKDEVLDPAALRARIERHGITAMLLTTVLFNRCVDADPAMFASMRILFFGGEAGDSRRAARLRRAAPGLRIVNAYGPTEATTIATTYELPAAPEADERLPIGRPVPGTTVAVLDRHGRPSGPGEPGELHIGGAGLVRGYLGRPDLTAQRFAPAAGGDRLYRTGDLARWRPGGELEFLGRADDQVKIRGVRIEPDEIAGVLATAPGIRAAAVTVAGADDARHLVAHVVPDGEIDRRELRSWLAARLPEAMVPAFYVPLAELPVTPNGKLDRRALPAPGPGDGVRAAVFTPPSGPVAELIAGVWAELLGVPRISADDDFFALGGHSLLAAQAVARIAARLGVELGVRSAFAAPVLRDLAELAAAAPRTAFPPPVAVAGDGPFAVSFAQQRLWFLDRLAPHHALYNVPLLLTIDGPLDVPALRASIEALVSRHAALRTRIVTVDDEPRQVIDLPAGVDVPLVDLRERADAADDMVRRAAAQPFDLAAGPLLRAALIRVADDRHLLILTVHHAVSDGWSVGVLLRDLGALYAGRTPPAPALRYVDFARWQRDLLDGPVRRAQLDYWTAHLVGAPPSLELPVDRPRPAEPRHRGETFEIRLRPQTAALVRGVGRAYGATPFMVLLASLQLVLGRYAGVADVSVGAPVSGRTRPEFEDLVGFFVNTVVVRTRWQARDTFAALLDRVRTGVLAAYEHQDVPFEQVVEAVRPSREPGLSPLFQVMMSMQNVPPHLGVLPGLAVEVSEPDAGVAKFDLTVAWDEAPLASGELRGRVEYDVDLFDRSTVDRLAAHYVAVLEAALATPEIPVARLPMVAMDRGTETERASTLTALFAASAARHSGRIALRQDGRELTYAELDARAARIAAALAARGIGPGDRVAVATGRTLDWPAALLGVLRAGAAYVPVDPDAPAERTAHLLRDSGARLVLRAGELIEQDGRADFAAPHPASIAYVLYTSGTTGQPKGVAVSHANLAHTLRAVADRYELGPDDRVLQFAALTFDVAAEELFATLIRGGTVVLLPDGPVPGIPELTALAARERLTVLNLPASYWHEWVSLLDRHPAAALPDLRLTVVGSERVDGTRLARWKAAVPDRVRWLNAYGPTEATITATVHEPPTASAGTVPIGEPLCGVRAYVLDDALNPVPVGVPGELYLAGPGVALGYVGDPGKTAASFLPDPWGPPGARMYATRDRAKRTAAGVLEFLGRSDGQIKLRGFRIEPGEIEAALNTHPLVREAAAMLREDVPGRPVLTGYVAAPPEVTETGLRNHLAERLPGYLVPRAYVVLDRLPRGDRDKIDRAALPAPARPTARPDAEQPAGVLERTVADVWSHVLAVERVGLDENFFELGGHSLLLLRVQGRLAEELGRPVAVVDLLRYPTVRSLARRLTEDTEHIPAGGSEGRRRAEARRVSSGGRGARRRARPGNGDAE